MKNTHTDLLNDIALVFKLKVVKCNRVNFTFSECRKQMHTEINSFRVYEGKQRENQGGKPVLKREYGCTSSLLGKKKTVICKGNSGNKYFFVLYISETYK